MTPNLVASCTRAVEAKSKRAEASRDFTVSKSGKAPSGHHDRDSEFSGGNFSVAKYSGERVSVLAARFHNLSRKALSDFYGLGEASAFRYQSGNVWAGAQVPSPF